MQSLKTAYDSGLRFGDSELLRFDEDYAVFKCKCGDTFQKLKYKPYSEAMKNMMCSACRHKNRVQPHQAERQIFRRVASDAKNRNLSFDISLEWFIIAIHIPCHYCGSADANSALVTLHDESGKPYRIPYRYNGIDRMDNSIGYVEDNCLPCCFICNRAKRDMGYFEFEEYLINVARQWGNRV